MNPVDRAGPLTGTNFALSSYEKIQPSFRDEKRPKILGTSFGAKLEKQTKMAKRNLVITFAPIMALATLLAVSLQFNGLLMMWKLIRQSKTMPFGPPYWVMKLRCYVIDHLTHALLRRIHPGNRDEVFIWQNFPARSPRFRLVKLRSL